MMMMMMRVVVGKTTLILRNVLDVRVLRNHLHSLNVHAKAPWLRHSSALRTTEISLRLTKIAEITLGLTKIAEITLRLTKITLRLAKITLRSSKITLRFKATLWSKASLWPKALLRPKATLLLRKLIMHTLLWLIKSSLLIKLLRLPKLSIKPCLIRYVGHRIGWSSKLCKPWSKLLRIETAGISILLLSLWNINNIPIVKAIVVWLMFMAMLIMLITLEMMQSLGISFICKYLNSV